MSLPEGMIAETRTLLGRLLPVAALFAFANGVVVIAQEFTPAEIPVLVVDPATGNISHALAEAPAIHQFPAGANADEEIEGPRGVNFTVFFADDENEGFFDEELGFLRQNAFVFALNIWAELLEGDVDIVVSAEFNELQGNRLGQAGPTTFFRLPDQGLPNAFYPIALANQLAGEDLNDNFQFGGFNVITPEISAEFDSRRDQNAIGQGRWYYGTDGNPPAGDFDFVTVVLHEVGHGLGHLSFFNSFGFATDPPLVYDLFLVNGDGKRLLELEPSFSNVRGDNVFWDGSNGVKAYQEDFGGNGNCPIHAPSIYLEGTSMSHLDGPTFIGTKFGLMAPSLASGFAIHDPESITLGMLRDMGWNGEGLITGPDDEDPAEDIDDHPDEIPECTDLGDPAPDVNAFGIVFGTEGDLDVFCFSAFAGETFTLELFSTSPFENAFAEVSGPGGNGELETAVRDEPAEFTVPESGEYFITVGSDGSAPFESSFQFEIRLTQSNESQPGNQAGPIMATARATPTIGVAPLRVNLTGGANRAIEVGQWDFGDGGGDIGEAVSHIYSLPGTYTATFTAIGNGGFTGEASVVIRVLGEPNELPTASISASTTAGQAPLTVQFDGFGVDPDGQIVRFDWAFGDGDTGTGQNIEHTFTLNGTYNVVLTVTDDVGETGSDVLQIIVGDALAGGLGAGQPVPGAAPMCGSTSTLTYTLTLIGFAGLGLLRRRW